MKDKLRELAARWKSMGNLTYYACAVALLEVLDAEGEGGAVGCPELWIEFTDDGHNIRLWTRNEQQAAEEIREGRKLFGFYSRAPLAVLNEQSGNSGQLEFQNGVLEGLSIAKKECDRHVFALDGGDNKFRREATASQCAEAIRLVYARMFREIYPLPVIGTGDALQTLESFAMSGGELCGDDVPRFRALIDRIAPISHPARSGVVRDEDVRDAERYRYIRDNNWSADLDPVIIFHKNARWDAAIDAHLTQPAQSVDAEYLAALKDLYRGYILVLEAGMDRITSLGGSCDPVDVMEKSDPFLITARRTIAALQEKGNG